jgi:hypothetical protein
MPPRATGSLRARSQGARRVLTRRTQHRDAQAEHRGVRVAARLVLGREPEARQGVLNVRGLCCTSDVCKEHVL